MSRRDTTPKHVQCANCGEQARPVGAFDAIQFTRQGSDWLCPDCTFVPKPAVPAPSPTPAPIGA